MYYRILCIFSLIGVLFFGEIKGQYSSDSLNNLISHFRDFNQDEFRLYEMRFKEVGSKVLKIGVNEDFEKMSNDSNIYIKHIGIKGIQKNLVTNLKPNFINNNLEKEWNEVISKIKVDFGQKDTWISYSSGTGGYSTFQNLDTESLKELIKLDNPILKFLAFRSFIYHRTELDTESRLTLLKNLIIEVCKDESLISIREGCVINLGRLPFVIYTLVEGNNEFHKADWEKFFKEEKIDINHGIKFLK